MMTSAEYLKGSTVFRSGHKNPLARDIQKLLDAYYAVGASPNRKIKLLVLMYFLCMEFVRSKGEKAKDSNKTVRLMKQIELEFVSPAFKTQYDNMVAGESYKNGVLKPNPNVNKPGTPLNKVYGTEKVLPQNNLIGKLNLETNVKSFGVSALSQMVEDDFSMKQGLGPNQAASAAHDLLNGISFKDLMKKVHELWGRAGDLNAAEFNFLDAGQRQQYEATCTGGVIACNGHNPYSSGFSPAMYALSRANQFYIPAGRGGIGNGFNHSSLLSGAPVLCAGTIEVSNAGALRSISNDSGHYKPGTMALVDAVEFLINSWGLNGNTFKVYDKVVGFEYPTATQFLRQFRTGTAASRTGIIMGRR